MHPTPSNIFADGNRIVITSRFAGTDTRKFWEVFEKVIENCDSLKVNLHACSYIDSSGLGIIMSVKSRCDKGGIPLSIELVENSVFQIFRIACLDKILELDVIKGASSS